MAMKAKVSSTTWKRKQQKTLSIPQAHELRNEPLKSSEQA